MKATRHFIYNTVQGDMLDEICYKYYGFSAGAVERVLEENPHISYLGYVFEKNEKIKLPDIPKEVRVKKEVRLWD
jgi:phage tail protein X